VPEARHVLGLSGMYSLHMTALSIGEIVDGLDDA
jgi:hypothetical protein